MSLRAFIKIGLVATSGTAIIVPVFLSQSIQSTTSPNHSTVEGDGQVENLAKSTNSSISPEASQAREQQLSSLPTIEPLTNSDPENEELSRDTKEGIDKKCFVIPAKSSNNSELLICLDNKELLVSRNDYEEYGSSYYLYDSSRAEKLLKIEKKLSGDPANSQISVQLKEGEDITLIASEDQGKGISDSEMDLLQECALFGSGSKAGVDTPSYKLVCGGDTTEFSPENPKGISLTLGTIK